MLQGFKRSKISISQQIQCSMCVCVCACVCACMRACVRACVRTCVCARACAAHCAGIQAELILGAAERGLRAAVRGGGGGLGREVQEGSGGGGEGTREEGIGEKSMVNGSSVAEAPNADYLRERARYSEDKLVDGDGGGVMMAWERGLMHAHAHVVCQQVGEFARLLLTGFIDHRDVVACPEMPVRDLHTGNPISLLSSLLPC